MCVCVCVDGFVCGVVCLCGRCVCVVVFFHVPLFLCVLCLRVWCGVFLCVCVCVCVCVFVRVVFLCVCCVGGCVFVW